MPAGVLCAGPQMSSDAHILYAGQIKVGDVIRSTGDTADVIAESARVTAITESSHGRYLHFEDGAAKWLSFIDSVALRPR